MTVLHADLDNTLIYSYRHDIGPKKRRAELYEGREVSFMTERTRELLRAVKERMLVVPTTTRTREQYERIDLGAGAFPYALVCNGGVLLNGGQEDAKWYEESRRRIAPCRGELERALERLSGDPRRIFKLQFVRELFVYTKCERTAEAAEELRKALDPHRVQVLSHGTKLYVVPLALSKGEAVKRFRARIGADRVLAAGDSIFDVSMLAEADRGLAPLALAEETPLPAHAEAASGSRLYSEEMLEWALALSERDSRQSLI